MTKEFTDDNFLSDVIEASTEKPVLVDFFAVWCGPCKMQSPIVDEVAEELGDKAIVGKLDTEAAPQTAAKYGIMSIPALIIFRDKEPVETMIGMQPKEVLIAAIEKHV